MKRDSLRKRLDKEAFGYLAALQWFFSYFLMAAVYCTELKLSIESYIPSFCLILLAVCLHRGQGTLRSSDKSVDSIFAISHQHFFVACLRSGGLDALHDSLLSEL